VKRSSPLRRVADQPSGTAPRRGPGRPRDAQRHEAILDATRGLILEAGYSRVTLDAVAKRAGVSRTTVHKWWGHRALLVEEALFPDYSELPLPDTGSFDGDLEYLVKEVVQEMTRPELVRGMPPLRAEILSNAGLLESTRSLYADPAIERWEVVFERAAGRGEIPPSTDARAALHVVVGAVAFMAQAQPKMILPKREMTSYLVSLLLRGIRDG
jgi:AcrR family transcriptional regulator